MTAEPDFGWELPPGSRRATRCRVTIECPDCGYEWEAPGERVLGVADPLPGTDVCRRCRETLALARMWGLDVDERTCDMRALAETLDKLSEMEPVERKREIARIRDAGDPTSREEVC